MMTEAELEQRQFVAKAAIASQQAMLSTDISDEFNWCNPDNHEDLAETAMDAAEALYREFIRRHGSFQEE